ncbi:MAG: ABC transporter substrate-binding protein [Acidimicrobiia bacterium]
MNRSKRWPSIIALVAVLALVLAACGSSSSKKSSPTSTTKGASTDTTGALTVGAEQDAACADWVDACAASSWGAYMMMYQTMPRVFDYAKQGDDWTEIPSPTMAGMPTVTTVNGKQTVTYTISDAAVWSDGQPITSTDFKYTWDQIVNGKNIYDPTGYTQIESIDTTNPKVAVATFSKPFASWTQLFSADYGIFPSHLLQGKDRDKEMKNGYTWSGGPWLMKWDRGVSVTLTPNPKWYGPKPTIQKVIFKIITNTASEFEAFKSQEVSAIYPQPEPSAIAAIKGGIEGTNSLYSADTANIEALWINNAKFPFDSVAVRQAIGYAIDRNAIVARLFGDLGVRQPAQTLNPPIVSRYADKTAWSNYVLNLGKVNSLMTADGWAKNSDGLWAKGGKTASFTIKSTTDNKRRELTEQILQEQLKAAGFKLTIKNLISDDLFGTVLPAGDYQMSLYSQTSTSLNPGLCTIACTKNIPTKANKNTGDNVQRISNATLDPLLETVDTNFVESERISASKQADQIMAQDQVSLPVDPLPNIVLWSNKITGPVGDNPVLSMFWNMYLWRVAG